MKNIMVLFMLVFSPSVLKAAGLRERQQITITINVQNQDWLNKRVLDAVKANACVTVVEDLLKAGAQTNVKDNLGNCLLTLAVRNKNEELVRLLFRYGTEVNDQCSALGKAADNSDFSMAQLLLSLGTPANMEYFNSSAIITAANRGSCSVVKLLIEHGANPNFASNLETPLIAALMYLYSAKFESNIKTQKEAEELLKYFLGDARELSTIRRTKPNLESLDVNQCSKSGESPLFYAASNGLLQQVELLIAFGADLEKFCRGNTSTLSKVMFTPLMIAARNGHVEIVSCFLQHGANPLATFDGKDALYYAQRARNNQIIGLLEDAIKQKQNKTTESAASAAIAQK